MLTLLIDVWRDMTLKCRQKIYSTISGWRKGRKANSRSNVFLIFLIFELLVSRQVAESEESQELFGVFSFEMLLSFLHYSHYWVNMYESFHPYNLLVINFNIWLDRSFVTFSSSQYHPYRCRIIMKKIQIFPNSKSFNT